jgi:hypothetical protein
MFLIDNKQATYQWKNRTKPQKDLKTEYTLTAVNRGILKKEIKI